MDGSLANARIWLSGAIDKGESEDGKKIAAFVEAFAAEVFRRGGTIVHGCQPKITLVLLRAAKAFVAGRPLKAKLALMVSNFYSKDPEANRVGVPEWNDVFKIDIPAWDKLCAEPVVETRPAPSEAKPEMMPSAAVLRERMADQANVFVAVGGKWWESDQVNAGVPIEINLARVRKLPMFLLGGLGGATAGQLAAMPALLGECHNGQTNEKNKTLSELADPKTLAKEVVEAISRLPLQDRSAENRRPFRILSLDGGGICGAYTAAVLAHWEKNICEDLDVPLAAHFDLIAGTSAGGILAVGLGMGLKASELLGFYEKHGPAIFPKAGGAGALNVLGQLFRSKYKLSVLEERIRGALEGRGSHLRQSGTRLLIPAYDSRVDGVLLMRTPHAAESAKSDRDWESVPAAVATAAAPTYFDPKDVGNYRAIDGGVWANSPSIVALAEAIRELGVDPRRVEILSVGTTYGTKQLGRPLEADAKLVNTLLTPVLGGGFRGRLVKWLVSSLLKKSQPIHGILGWLPNIAGFLMKAQAQGTAHAIERLLGPDRFLRVDTVTRDLAMDDAEAIPDLVDLGGRAAQENHRHVSQRFLNGVRADPWQKPPPAAPAP